MSIIGVFKYYGVLLVITLLNGTASVDALVLPLSLCTVFGVLGAFTCRLYLGYCQWMCMCVY